MKKQTPNPRNILLLQDLENFSANTLLINAGGIMAFYPTELDFHYRNPFLKNNNMLADVVRKCHEKGIKVIVRFDFSRIQESIFKRIPTGAIFLQKVKELSIPICTLFPSTLRMFRIKLSKS